MSRGRNLIRGFLGAIGLAALERFGNAISVLMILLAIAYVFVIAYATVKWCGAMWLLLTIPVGILLGIPVMRGMARLSGSITN